MRRSKMYRMTRKQQRQFVNELIRNVKSGIMAKMSQIPEEWDGRELRLLISDHFKAAIFKDTMTRSQIKAYNNEVMVKNLI